MQDRIVVWDWPVRVVHWLMVLLLVTLVVTAWIGGGALTWHMRAGEAMLTLVLFRVAWGFAGSRYARFSSFLRGPRAVMSYARSLVRAPHERHAGHNPMGGWMVILLLAALLVQTVAGLFANDDVLTEGPLAKFISKDLSDTISTFHSFNGWVVVGLACFHVAAVIAYYVVLKDDLVRPMLRGYKRRRSDVTLEPAVYAGAGLTLRALVLVALCAGAVVYVVTR